MPLALVAASQSVLVITAGLLFWMAFVDLRDFRIRNAHVVLLAILFFVHAGLSGRWITLHWNLAFAVAMGVLLLLGYAMRILGGGDVKLLAVAFVWTGFRCAVPFLLFVTAASLLMIVAAHFQWIKAHRVNGRLRVPFAPAIAVGLIAIFMLNCLASNPGSGSALHATTARPGALPAS